MAVHDAAPAALLPARLLVVPGDDARLRVLRPWIAELRDHFDGSANLHRRSWSGHGADLRRDVGDRNVSGFGGGKLGPPLSSIVTVMSAVSIAVPGLSSRYWCVTVNMRVPVDSTCVDI